MNMLDDVGKLKRQMWDLMTTRENKKRFNKFGEVADLLPTLQVEAMGEEEEETEEINGDACTTDHYDISSLLKLRYQKEYNKEEEEKIDSQIKRKRDLQSNGSTPVAENSRGRSDRSDSVVSPPPSVASGRSENSTPTKKHPRRRRGRKKWTHIKGSRYRSNSVASRPSSVSSGTSVRSRSTSRTSTSSSISSHRTILYDEEDRLIGNKTRYVSKEQERQNTLVKEWLENKTMYCAEKSCPVYFENVDVYNLHLIEEHNYMKLYFCEQCQQGYVNEYLLRRHQKKHDIIPFICSMCLQRLPNQVAFKKHQEDHNSYSVACQYCDKFFLSLKQCEQHKAEEHQHEKRKGKRRKKRLIIEFVQSSSWHPDTAERKCPSPSTLNVRCYSGLHVPGETLDVTEENLRAHGETFHAREDMTGSEENCEENAGSSSQMTGTSSEEVTNANVADNDAESPQIVSDNR